MICFLCFVVIFIFDLFILIEISNVIFTFFAFSFAFCHFQNYFMMSLINYDFFFCAFLFIYCGFIFSYHFVPSYLTTFFIQVYSTFSILHTYSYDIQSQINSLNLLLSNIINIIEQQINKQSTVILTAKIKTIILTYIEYNKSENPKMSMQLMIASHEGLNKYLMQHLCEINQESVCDNILGMLEERDETIRAMEIQITKFKADNNKNNKVIAQLQDKISQMCPNTNNTGSSFMMASEFKDYFDDFMKNCLPTCLAPLLSYPSAYSQYTQQMLAAVYGQINTKINNVLNEICKILCVQNTSQNIQKTKISVLKIMQQNWRVLLYSPISKTQQHKQNSYIKNIPQFQNQQIAQITQTEQFEQLGNKLTQICSYMILQEKKWQFVMEANKIQKYVKKDYTCIDGWIKEKQDVIVMLDGLARQNQQGSVVRHPNLRNYVIPYVQDNDQPKYLLVPKPHQQKQQEPQFEKQNIQNNNKIVKVDQYCQYSPKGLTLPLSTKILKQRQQQMNKQNKHPLKNIDANQMKSDASYSSLKANKNMKKFKKQRDEKAQQKQQDSMQQMETGIHKVAKVNTKLTQNAVQTESVLLPASFFKGVKNSHQSSNHTLRLHNIQNINDHQPQHATANPSSSLVKPSKIKNTKNATHNLISDPSFQQILPIPHRKRDITDQLPLKRQSSKNKKSNSRKASAGKIVGQAVQSKQNNLNRNNKEKQNKENINKEAIYKDMIKQKLGNEHKTERGKQSKHKQREQDRPLRIMHLKKIREKYLNL